MKPWMRFLLVLLLALPRHAPAASFTLEPIALATPSDAAGQLDLQSGVRTSADGRYTLMASRAVNLVAGQQDVPDSIDLFVHDRVAGTTQLVTRSAGTSATTCGRNSYIAGRAISDDGRWISFVSECATLIAGAVVAPNSGDVYLFDRLAGTNRLLTRQPGSADGAGSSRLMDMSADGRWILIASFATTIAPGGSFGEHSLLLFDRDDPSGALPVLVPRLGDYQSFGSGTRWISADGSRIAFVSRRSTLDPAIPEVGGVQWLFAYTRKTRATRMVSRRAGQNFPANFEVRGGNVLVSADGSRLAYVTAATDIAGGQAGVFMYNAEQDQNALLVPPGPQGIENPVALSADGDWLLSEEPRGNGSKALRLYEARTGMRTLVDHAANLPAANGNGSSVAWGLSGDGRFALYESTSSDLAPLVSDGNQQRDMFLFDRQTGSSRLLSVAATGAAARAADGESGGAAALSDNGGLAVYGSSASNLAVDTLDANAQRDLYLSESTRVAPAQLATRAASTISATASRGSASGQISPDGRWMTFVWQGSVRLRDRATGAEWLVDAAFGRPGQAANFTGTPLAVSPDGRWVWFQSLATDLVPGYVFGGAPSDPPPSLYLYDRDTQAIQMITRQTGAGMTSQLRDAYFAGSSDDGRWTLFSTDAQGIAGTGSSSEQVFLFDRDANAVQLVSASANVETAQVYRASRALQLSADGRWVLFSSYAPDLIAGVVDQNNDADIFLFDRVLRSTRLISRSADDAARTANGRSDGAVLDTRSGAVLFQSGATDLLAAVTDRNHGYDIYRRDLGTDAVSLVSHAATQAQQTGDGQTYLPGVPFSARSSTPRKRILSADGRRLLLASYATDLQAGVTDTSPSAELYVADLPSSTMRLITHEPGQPLRAAFGDTSHSYSGALSANGERILFEATGTMLTAGAEPSQARQVYLAGKEVTGNVLLTAPAVGPLSYVAGSAWTDMDATGQILLLSSAASNLLNGVVDQNGGSDAFIAHCRSTPYLLADATTDPQGGGCRVVPMPFSR